MLSLLKINKDSIILSPEINTKQSPSRYCFRLIDTFKFFGELLFVSLSKHSLFVLFSEKRFFLRSFTLICYFS